MNRKASFFLIGFAVAAFLRADEAPNPAWDDLEVSILHPAFNAPAAANSVPNLSSDNQMVSALSAASPSLWNVNVAVGDHDGTGPWDASAGLAGRSKDLRAEWAAVDEIRASRSNRDGLHHRIQDTVFTEPETFRAGRMEVGGGFINAIKQRNPFCLLTPIVFWVSF